MVDRYIGHGTVASEQIGRLFGYVHHFQQLSIILRIVIVIFVVVFVVGTGWFENVQPPTGIGYSSFRWFVEFEQHTVDYVSGGIVLSECSAETKVWFLEWWLLLSVGVGVVCC